MGYNLSWKHMAYIPWTLAFQNIPFYLGDKWEGHESESQKEGYLWNSFQHVSHGDWGFKVLKSSLGKYGTIWVLYPDIYELNDIKDD